MWPYTQDEATWLAEPQESAAEHLRRAIDRKWLREIGVSQDPANDEPAEAISMVDPRR